MLKGEAPSPAGRPVAPCCCCCCCGSTQRLGGLPAPAPAHIGAAGATSVLHFSPHGAPTCWCAPLVLQVVKLCYDQDLLSEEAILDWAHEKEHAGEEDRRFVDMCADLLAWLEDAEEESSEEEDSE